MSPELADFVSRLLDKNVLSRLDVAAALQHPWVTLGGSAPLPSMAAAAAVAAAGSGGSGGASGSSLLGGLAVSQREIDEAIRQISSSTREAMDVVFEELHLAPG